MNTYKIIFTRENGTQGTDHFTAINERQARKDFGECYRHSSWTWATTIWNTQPTRTTSIWTSTSTTRPSIWGCKLCEFQY